eukprot:4552769-Amphidinium_carterae.1
MAATAEGIDTAMNSFKSMLMTWRPCANLWSDGREETHHAFVLGMRRLQEFMQKSGKLNDLISHFTQKFVQVGERRNFALTVLTDMAWTILILTWEAHASQRACLDLHRAPDGAEIPAVQSWAC